MVELKDREGKTVPARALCDTGTSGTIILKNKVQKGRVQSKKKRRTKWKTHGGVFTTNYQSLIDFKLPEFDTNKVITWPCHVDDKTIKENAQFDMIIGMDLMVDIGLVVDCENKLIKWEEMTIPVKQRNLLSSNEVLEMIYLTTGEPEVLKQAEDRHKHILDADYSKVDINSYVQELENLTPEQRDALGHTLKKFPILFGCRLGTLNIPPIDLELKEGAKPYHAHLFPIPQCYERTTKVEIDRLTKIGVLNNNYDS